MYTIYDYLNLYKDKNLNEVPWNMMDYLLCSLIVYIPMGSFMGSKTFDEICNLISSFNISKHTEFISYKVKELINIVKGSTRYKKLRIKNFENIVNESTQFGAMTCIIDNTKIIVFKGTDRSIIGWIENIRLMYEYPTFTQALAIRYLKNNIGLFDKDVHVIGHSKGGNMAMSSVMELGDFKFNKVKKVINFDGPGFKKNEYESPKYMKMSEKLINIVPSNSYIGTLMFNKNYQSIKTSAHAINVHYPIYWNTDGTEFVYEKLSKLSEELHIRTTKNIQDVNEQIIKAYFETAFSNIKKKGSHIGFNINEFIDIIKGMSKLDKSTYDYVNSFFKSLIKLSNKE